MQEKSKIKLKLSFCLYVKNVDKRTNSEYNKDVKLRSIAPKTERRKQKMKTMTLKKLIALLTALLMSWGIIAAPAAPEKPDGGIVADSTIDFNDSNPGCAGSTVSVTSNYDGEYSVFWGTADGEKLSAKTASGAEKLVKISGQKEE